MSMWCVFFFQAEDGIRDLVRSRGLGDVYKRQIAHIPNGNLRLRDEFAHVDARKRFTIDVSALWHLSLIHI